MSSVGSDLRRHFPLLPSSRDDPHVVTCIRVYAALSR